VKTKFTEKLRSDPHQFSPRKVEESLRKDGLKLVFAVGSRICCRLSGIEPDVRLCSEARSWNGLKQLSAAAKGWIVDSLSMMQFHRTDSNGSSGD
jgi:phosphoglucomutase